MLAGQDDARTNATGYQRFGQGSELYRFRARTNDERNTMIVQPSP